MPGRRVSASHRGAPGPSDPIRTVCWRRAYSAEPGNLRLRGFGNGFRQDKGAGAEDRPTRRPHREQASPRYQARTGADVRQRGLAGAGMAAGGGQAPSLARGLPSGCERGRDRWCDRDPVSEAAGEKAGAAAGVGRGGGDHSEGTGRFGSPWGDASVSCSGWRRCVGGYRSRDQGATRST